jgi:hypothetical protein
MNIERHHRRLGLASRVLATALAISATPALAQSSRIDLSYEVFLEAEDRGEQPLLGTPIYADESQANPDNAGYLARAITFAPYPISGYGTPGVGALVANWGNTFGVQANTPWRSSPAERLDVSFTQASVVVRESFRKQSDSDRMFFTYSFGELDLYRDPEVPRPLSETSDASLLWWVGVYRNADLNTPPVWADSNGALVEVDAGGFYRLRSFSRPDLNYGLPSGRGFANPNPLWQWDCPNCDTRARGRLEATLVAPYRGEVDLSAIPFDPLLPLDQQTEFTVVHVLFGSAEDAGVFSFAAASAQDPLSLTGGGAVEVLGLVQTNNPIAFSLGASPVPESESALMLAVGLLSLWLRRPRRR